ncbi:MAG: serine/threonine transporter SstT [Bacteroidaceae bacterium]|nr:serine/threonine transporter SstT [Bacteroidaceae bacterium]
MKVILSCLKAWSSMSLMLRILVGLVTGACLGLFCPQFVSVGVLGEMFVGALKAIAPVLVAVLVVASVAKAKNGLGKRFRTVITLYVLTTLLAAIVAVVGSFIFPVTVDLKETQIDAEPIELSDVFSNLLTNMVTNPLQAVASANYLGILFWSVIIGLGLKLKANEKTIDVVNDFSEVVSKVVGWIIQFAPFGIMGLVFNSVSQSGLDIFTDYGRLLLLLLGCMLFVYFVLNPIVVAFYLHRNPYPLVFRCFKESGLSAFFTRSSAANIPVNMALCNKLGLDKDFYSVSIPLGATINMDGAAVTITVMSLAVAHTMGIEVSLMSALFLSVIATLGACGTSGVAGGSLLLIPMACSFFGVSNDIAMQAVAIGFIIGVVQDSVETALNSSGDVLFTATAELHDRMKKASGSPFGF